MREMDAPIIIRAENWNEFLSMISQRIGSLPFPGKGNYRLFAVINGDVEIPFLKNEKVSNKEKPMLNDMKPGVPGAKPPATGVPPVANNPAPALSQPQGVARQAAVQAESLINILTAGWEATLGDKVASLKSEFDSYVDGKAQQFKDSAEEAKKAAEDAIIAMTNKAADVRREVDTMLKDFRESIRVLQESITGMEAQLRGARIEAKLVIPPAPEKVKKPS